jgi:hypothetical protein
MTSLFNPALPLGTLDLDPNVQFDPGPPLRIRCFVSGCNHYLIPPARGRRGETCPTHGITCSRSPTYVYADVRRNIITARDLLADRIVGHPFKVESWRFGNERGEDALSFNLFRSFQEARCLNLIGRYVTGLDAEEEPRLYLWGLDLTDDSLRPWDLLIQARKRFERRLPVKRPKTEPDVGLFLPGQYLALLEAKFCSPNPFYPNGPRKDAQSLTKDELLDRYADVTLRYLDRQRAVQADRVYYQLWRNAVFAEFMAHLAGEGTQGYFANLTRRGCENASFSHFQGMVRPEFLGRVSHISWEDLFVLAGLSGGRLGTLQEYLLTKTANLLPAFHFGLW